MKNLRNRGKLLSTWWTASEMTGLPAQPFGLSLESLETRVVPAVITWQGDGVDDNWSTADNWLGNVAPTDGDSVVFDSDIALGNFSNENDIVGLSLIGITFDNDDVTSFVVTGNAIDFTGTILKDGTTADTLDLTTITLTGANTINGITSLTIASDLAGTGSIEKTGAGNTTLTGTNSYSGGTTVTAGTLTGNATSLQGDIDNNAAVVFNQAAAGTYSGDMSGSGSLEKQGAQTLILSGTNTYSGGTTITAGTLQGTTTSLQGDIINNATLIFNQTTAGTYAGVISGTGAVTKSSTGSVTFSGDNTYDGVTNISGGSLTFTGDTSGLGGDITNSGTVIFNQAADSSFANDITGTGALQKTGAGALTLSGANTYSGATTINAGTLIASGGTAIGDNSAVSVNGSGILQIDTAETIGSVQAQLNGASIVLNATLTTGGDNTDKLINAIISGSGGLIKVGTGNLLLTQMNTYSGGTTVSAGNLLGSHESLQGNILNNATVTFIQPISGTYSGVISGTGILVKQDVGTLVLSNTNTYTGPTTITGGTLAVDGSITSNVTVNSGGTLAGLGTVVGTVTVNSGGIVGPGNPLQGVNGVLRTQDVTLVPNTGLQITVNANSFDQLQVNGAVNISGSTLLVQPTNEAPLGSTLVIVNNDGTDPVVGNFTGLPEGTRFISGGFVYQITYVGGDGNDITIEVQGIPGTPVYFGDGTLRIFGTDGNDTIVVTQTSRQGFNGAEVEINGFNFGPYELIREIQIISMAGDDVIQLANDVRIPMKIEGGEGTDTLDFTPVSFAVSVYIGPGIQIPDEASIFLSVENIIGGSASDTFLIGKEGLGPGTLDGGVGINNLDLSRVPHTVTVDLQTGMVNGTMDIRNFQIYIMPLFFTSTIILPGGTTLTSFGGREEVLVGAAQFQTNLNVQNLTSTSTRSERSESSSEELVTLDELFAEAAAAEAAQLAAEQAAADGEVDPDAVDEAVAEEAGPPAASEVVPASN